jgi:hypothetical protein
MLSSLDNFEVDTGGLDGLLDVSFVTSLWIDEAPGGLRVPVSRADRSGAREYSPQPRRQARVDHDPAERRRMLSVAVRSAAEKFLKSDLDSKDGILYNLVVEITQSSVGEVAQ